MARTRNSSRALLLPLAILPATLTILLSVPAFSQTSGPHDDHSAQTQTVEDQDLINPDRPGIADGSTVVGSKTFQIESGIQFEFRHNGDIREHTFFVPTLLRLGVGSHFEARVEGNTFTRVTSFDGGDVSDQTSGFAPTSIGFKYQVYSAHQITLGTIVRVFPPWGSKDFHPQHTTGDIRLAADWSFASRLKLSLNPNIGVARYEDDQGRLFTAALFATTLNYLPTKRLNPFIDVSVQSPETSEGRSATVLDGGVAYAIGRNLEVDASSGTRVHGVTGPKPFLAFGISWRTRPFHGERRH